MLQFLYQEAKAVAQKAERLRSMSIYVNCIYNIVVFLWNMVSSIKYIVIYIIYIFMFSFKKLLKEVIIL